MNLISKNRKPYGGDWRYKHPVTGDMIIGGTWTILLKRIAEYNHANGIPIGLGFEKEVESILCKEHPDECTEDGKAKPERKRMSMSSVIRGTRFMGGLLLNTILGKESPFVSQEEANRRAQICSMCKYNVTFKKPCTGLCSELKAIISLTTKGRSTPHDQETAVCEICSCWSKVHVWFRLDLLDKGLGDIERAQFHSISHCWKKS